MGTGYAAIAARAVPRQVTVCGIVFIDIAHLAFMLMLTDAGAAAIITGKRRLYERQKAANADGR